MALQSTLLLIICFMTLEPTYSYRTNRYKINNNEKFACNSTKDHQNTQKSNGSQVSYCVEELARFGQVEIIYNC